MQGKRRSRVSQPANDDLVRQFIETLRRRTETDDALDISGDELESTLTEGRHNQRQPSMMGPLPNMVAAAVVLARALDKQKELLWALKSGSPTVVIEAPSPSMVFPLECALRICVLGPTVSTLS